MTNSSGENDEIGVFFFVCGNTERSIFFGRQGVEGAKEGAHI